MPVIKLVQNAPSILEDPEVFVAVICNAYGRIYCRVCRAAEYRPMHYDAGVWKFHCSHVS